MVICGMSGCNIIFHITAKTARFSGKKLNLKYVFRVSLQLPYETFLILRRISQIPSQMCIGVMYIPVILLRF
jgi:hypothetical protein